MSDLSLSDIGLDDLGTVSADGCLTDGSGLTSINNSFAGEGSCVGPCKTTKAKRFNKKRRQRLQKKLTGLELGTIAEVTGEGSVGTPKRMRDVSGTTPDMVVKKQRTFAETLVGANVRKFCVRETSNGMVINDEKLLLFKAELSRRILDVAKSSGFVPQMLGCYLSDGVIICKCSNEETFVWFGEAVKQIENIWSGCQLSVGDPPKPLLVHTWVPGPPENTSEATSNIGVMNPNLSTKGWKVVRYKREADRLSIVYKVDRKSLDLIIGSGHSLQYVLERIRFKVISGS